MAPKAADSSPVFSTPQGRHYVACRLRHILTLSTLGVQEHQYLADLQRRQARFIASLVNAGDPRVTHDLRIVSQPDPDRWTRGRIAVALLCRMDGGPAEAAHAQARDLLHLLESLFEEFTFDLVPADEVRGLLTPFPLRYVLALTRRAGVARLDSLRSSSRRLCPGFTTTVPPSAESDLSPDAIFQIFPYLATPTPFTSLWTLLLRHTAPVAISARLRPTRLTPEEEAFLEEQIARSERYAQVSLGSPSGDLSSLQPTLREQAKLHQQLQGRLLWGLRANAALLTLEVASSQPIPMPIVHTLGGLVSEPAGGMQGRTEESPHHYLAGGYEVSNGAETASARQIEAFEKLDLVFEAHPLAPAGAERLLYLFDAVEAGAVFRVPSATVEAPPGLTVRAWRSQPAPRELPPEGLLLGVSAHRGAAQPVRIGAEDRRRHLYIVGQTGTGKTTLVKSMILDDMQAGKGLCVVDPHGDLFKELVGKIPKERIRDVVLLDPTDAEYPVGLNMLEYDTEAQRHFLVQELVGILIRLLEDEYGMAAVGQFAGPIFFQHMRMNLLLAMSNPQDPGTLLEFYTIYQEKDYWRRWLPLKTSDPLLERWVKHVLPRTDYTKPGDEGASMGGYVGSKFEGFVFDPLLRRIFGQKRSRIDLRAIMDEGKILLVNLAKGELTEENARFFGMVLLAKIMAAAMGRVKVPEGERREFHLYVDEFQSLATQSFVTLLSEARKFGVSLVLANQFLAQVKDPRIVQAIFGNVGTPICFRLGQADAELMEREFSPTFSRYDLRNLPNWHACMRTLVRGQVVQPFTLETLPDATPFDDTVVRTVRARSRRKYGHPRCAAEEEIARSLRCPSEADREDQERT